jgi:hypothetical protein
VLCDATGHMKQNVDTSLRILETICCLDQIFSWCTVEINYCQLHEIFNFFTVAVLKLPTFCQRSTVSVYFSCQMVKCCKTSCTNTSSGWWNSLIKSLFYNVYFRAVCNNQEMIKYTITTYVFVHESIGQRWGNSHLFCIIYTRDNWMLNTINLLLHISNYLFCSGLLHLEEINTFCWES